MATKEEVNCVATKVEGTDKKMSPMGRPTISGEVKENTLRIRLTDEERKILDTAAANNGKPTGTWVRELALAAAESQPQKPAPRKRSKT